MDSPLSKEPKAAEQPVTLPESVRIVASSSLKLSPDSDGLAAQMGTSALPLVLRVHIAGGAELETLKRTWQTLLRDNSRFRALLSKYSAAVKNEENGSRYEPQLNWEEHNCRGLTEVQFSEWQNEFLQTERARAGRRDRVPLIRLFVLALEQETQIIWVLDPARLAGRDARQLVEILVSQFLAMRMAARNSMQPARASSDRLSSERMRINAKRPNSWTPVGMPESHEWSYTVHNDNTEPDANAAANFGESDQSKRPATGRTKGVGASQETVAGPDEETLRMQAQLRTIWESVFRKANIGLEDDFFALGGHSLIAARLLTRIHKVLGTELSLASLLDFPTIAGQAQLLRGNKGQEAIAVRETEPTVVQKPTIVLLGTDPTFQPLTKQLRENFRVRSIRLNASLIGGLKHSDSLQEIAALCNEALKKGEFGERYVLGGWCDHGLLALEMARQLRSDGIEVPLVLMLQTSNPTALKAYPPWKRFVSRTQLRWHLTNFEVLYVRHLGARQGVRYLFARLMQIIFRNNSLAARRKQLVNPATGERSERDYFDFLHSAAAHYEPASYEGPVVLFRGRERTYGFASFLDLGWGDLLGRNFAVCEVDGNHFTMFIPPYARGLAEKMAEYIRKSEEA